MLPQNSAWLTRVLLWHKILAYRNYYISYFATIMYIGPFVGEVWLVKVGIRRFEDSQSRDLMQLCVGSSSHLLETQEPRWLHLCRPCRVRECRLKIGFIYSFLSTSKPWLLIDNSDCKKRKINVQKLHQGKDIFYSKFQSIASIC